MKKEHRAGKSIVIVGAGPAGLSAALYLKRRGYTNVTVLEKLGRVGGLCRTITQDYENFDLGANYITPAFREVLKLAKQFGAKMYGERNGIAVELEDGKPPKWRNIWTAVKGEMSNVAFLSKCLKYAWLRYKLRPIIDRPGFAGISLHPDLCVSFDKWLTSHDLQCLRTLFEAPITIMGYGYIRIPESHGRSDENRQDKEIPAVYALKYMSFTTFVTLVVKLTPVFRWVPWPKRFVLGYQRLWQVVSFRLNVEKNINIERITRNVDGKRIKVEFRRLHQLDNEMQESDLTTIYYDCLIVACPLEASVIRTFLKDNMTPEEQGLFGHVISYSYKMTSCHVSDFKIKEPIVATLPLAPVGTPWAITQQYANSDMTQFYSRLPIDAVNYAPALQDEMEVARSTAASSTPAASEASLPDTPASVAQMKTAKTKPTTFVQGLTDGLYDPGLTAGLDDQGLMGGIDEQVEACVRQIGGTIEYDRWRTFDQWPYFQHFRVQEIKEGYYDRLEAMQGTLDTYYVGGLMNFELVDMIMVYSKHIVETHFPPVSPAMD